MHETALVGVTEAEGDLAREGERARCGERSLFGDQRRERAAVDQLHRDEHQAAVGLAEVDHRDDVRMIELARRVGFLREPQPHLERRGAVADHHLDRELLVREQRVVCAIDARHRSLADERVDHVVLPDRGTEQRIAVQLLDHRAIDRTAREVRAVRRPTLRAPAHARLGSLRHQFA